MTKSKKHDALFASRIKTKGRYAFGDGLYLQVKDSGTKSWLFRYMLDGKPREMGLGSYLPPSKNEVKSDKDLPLTEARAKAIEWRRLLKKGVDPIKARDQEEHQKRLEAASEKTFKECAEHYLDAHLLSWKNPKHRQQWQNTLEKLVYPKIGHLNIRHVSTQDVLKVIEPMWKSKTETASRIRGRIEAVWDWAKARGMCEGENPARWKGNLKSILPHRRKQQKIKHHAALPYQKINKFINDLDMQIGESVQAMKLVIFTATRTSEVRGADWREFNLSDKVWVIPADRIKGGREQRIPLSAPAMQILQAMQKKNSKGLLFKSRDKKSEISDGALLMLRKRMGYADKEKGTHITIHGFRSAFRDWAAEQTSYPREVIEHALAHVNKDKTEAAYFRSDLFEKRRQLMEDWAKFCLKKPS